MPADLPPNLNERLTAWRKAVAEADEEANQRRRHASEAEEYFLRIATISLWLAGLAACWLLAWRASGESLLLTTIIMALPILMWFRCGLWVWGLLLPISLLAVLALQGALRLW